MEITAFLKNTEFWADFVDKMRFILNFYFCGFVSFIRFLANEP